MTRPDRLRICLVAAARHPVRQPFAGGLEALTHALATALVARGHDVSVFAAPGSDPALSVTDLPVAAYEASDAAASDVGAPSRAWMRDHHAYLGLMLELGRTGAERFDLVHNHSLHHLPVAMADTLPIPVVTTLHTPPTPWLESAVTLSPGAGVFTAVSAFTAAAWSHAVASTPILNGVDTGHWRAGPGGGPAVWSGRLVAEKAPHEAMDAAREAGVPLVIAGPLSDPSYFEREVAPRLGPHAVHVGHLDHHALALLLARASVAIVTPQWDEPYGLVAAEAMACGTPVAAYARGALPEIVVGGTGVLATPGDVGDLARAVREAATCSRERVRAHVVREHSLTRMVDEYERFYLDRLAHGQAA